MNGVCCSSSLCSLVLQLRHFSLWFSTCLNAWRLMIKAKEPKLLQDLSYNDLSGSLPSWVNQQNLDLCIVFKGQGEDLFIASFR
ncbi:hypothetical protein RIF29_00842 [Crotalaria pallida]|uniref:Uncharacterized protein n=1 Tax=Crotalaria pallida TaxID=3830 RepID=A0AAN9IX19_CROPI